MCARLDCTCFTVSLYNPQDVRQEIKEHVLTDTCLCFIMLDSGGGPWGGKNIWIQAVKMALKKKIQTHEEFTF